MQGHRGFTKLVSLIAEVFIPFLAVSACRPLSWVSPLTASPLPPATRIPPRRRCCVTWSFAAAPAHRASPDLCQTATCAYRAPASFSLIPSAPSRALAAPCRGLTASVWVQSLSHCELITDDGIRHLGNGACAHDRLEVIELDNCPLITDASLEHLKSCHSLERIELYDCQQITRAGIKRLRVRE